MTALTLIYQALCCHAELRMKVSVIIRGLLLAAAVLIVGLYLFHSGMAHKSTKKKKEPYVRSIDFVCTGDSHEQLVDGISFILYVMCHDEKSLSIAKMWTKCMPWARTVLVPPSIYFESASYVSVFPKLEEEWDSHQLIGVATYKSLKFLTIEKLKAYVELAYYRPYDVVPLYTSGEYLVPQAVKGHTQEFKTVWEALLQRIGSHSLDEIRRFDRTEAFFRNTFVISPKWFRRLIHFMQQAVAAVEGDAGLKQLLSRDAHYAEGKQPVAQTVFKKDHYEWFPFLFERLPCFYFAQAGAAVFTTLREVSLFENTEKGMDSLYKGL